MTVGEWIAISCLFSLLIATAVAINLPGFLTERKQRLEKEAEEEEQRRLETEQMLADAKKKAGGIFADLFLTVLGGTVKIIAKEAIRPKDGQDSKVTR